jgi:uncharacterized protein (TIGR02145 family)
MMLFILPICDSFAQKEELKTVKIGNQIWMTKNLDVDKFRNGDPIPQAKTQKEWANAGNNQKPAWCYYENSTANGKLYGKLYNWYAVNDPRGLAPEGWHVPSFNEWNELVEKLDYDNPQSDMKNTTGWGRDGNGNNRTGYSGLPAGTRWEEGEFEEVGKSAYWWSSTDEEGDWGAYHCSVDYSSFGPVAPSLQNKQRGLSVRCIKDNFKKPQSNNQYQDDMYNNSFDQNDYNNCYDWIKTGINKKTSDTVFESIDKLYFYSVEEEHGFTIRMNKTGYNGAPWILFNTFGSGNCIEENNRIVIVFKDKAKIETTGNSKNNCNNNCWLKVESSYIKDLMYKNIDKIQVHTKEGSVEEILTKKQADEFRTTFKFLVNLCD